MSTVVKGLAPTLESQLPEGSLARRAVSGLKSAADWLGLSDDASVETSTMGPIGPAITMVTKKPLTELLRRLAPRTPEGRVLDPASYPNITDATSEIVERFPRVASHIYGIRTGLRDARGEHVIPRHLTELAQQRGAAGLREQPASLININEQLIEKDRPYQTLAHEFGHVAQFLADPRRFDKRYRLYGEQLGYGLNPYELSTRSIGRNQVARRAGGLPVGAFSAGQPQQRADAQHWLRQLEERANDAKLADFAFREDPQKLNQARTQLWWDANRGLQEAADEALSALRQLRR